VALTVYVTPYDGYVCMCLLVIPALLMCSVYDCESRMRCFIYTYSFRHGRPQQDARGVLAPLDFDIKIFGEKIKLQNHGHIGV
jgi:hypothetical protein